MFLFLLFQKNKNPPLLFQFFEDGLLRSTFSGYTCPNRYLSKTNNVHLRFESDPGSSEAGFQLNFQGKIELTFV